MSKDSYSIRVYSIIDPIAGLLVYHSLRGTNEEKAKAAKTGAIFGIVVYFILAFIFYIWPIIIG